MAVTDGLNPNFMLPDMGDFYYDAPDQQRFYAEMDRAVNPVSRKNGNSTAIAKFYQEEPPLPGAGDDNTFTFSIKLDGGGVQEGTETVRGIQVADGDTITIPYRMIQAHDEASAEYLNHIVIDADSMARLVAADTVDTKMTIRLAGLDCKELPHFTKAGVEEVTEEEICCTIAEIQEKGSAVFSKYRSFMDEPSVLSNVNGQGVRGAFFNYARTSETCNFVRMRDGKWHQYFSSGSDMYVLRACDTNGYDTATITDAGIARDVMANAIAGATEMRIQIDGTKFTRTGQEITTMFRTHMFDESPENIGRSYLDMFFDNYTQFTRAGFNYWGLDAYGRAIAAIYVKMSGRWINLNKMIIADTDATVVNKYSQPGDGSIDTSDYDLDAKHYADSIYEQSKKFDDREKVQGEIFKALHKEGAFKALKEWTVTIGDVTLFVPPTSIRCLSQTKAEHMPVLRAKGTMAKSATKMQRIIEMDIFFNEEHGINGYKCETTTLPEGRGKQITYWMNGLRALYAQFRVAPFLPIDNKYVNEVLGIDAVTMLNFACETVPGFPRLVKATIQLSEFEYRVYMPEIPMDDGDDDDNEIRNYFSRQINYPLLRYYYQRLLRHGEELRGVDFLDDKYITSTFGNRTCLVPSEFRDPYIRFYIPDKSELDKMKAEKITRMTKYGGADAVTTLNDKDKQYADDLAKIDNELRYLGTGSDEGASCLEDLNNYLSGCDSEMSLVVKEDTPGLFEVGYFVDGAFTTTEASLQARAQLDELMKELCRQYIINMEQLKNRDGDALFSNTSGHETLLDNQGNSAVFGFGFTGEVNTRYMSNEESKKLKTLAASASDGSYSADEVLKGGKAKIIFTTKLQKVPGKEGVFAVSLGRNGTAFALDRSGDAGFFGVCANISDNGGFRGNEEARGTQQNINLVTKSSIKFDPYNAAEDFLVEGIHVSTSNSFSQITLQETNGFAPQYVGGTDITINISMYTKSRQAAASMNLLPSISAEFARNYRLVLSAWPLRIESEFTKMFGITDAMVESVEVDTVPNYPEFYHIQLSLVSVDRTLRNREAMQKKDMKNFHNLSIEGVSANRTWEYNQMNQFLAEAELYPDLELPTLKELEEAGFSFIRYSNKSRIYPDPDFYFTYSYVLVSQIIREAVLHGLDSACAEMDIRDSSGKRMQGNLKSSMKGWYKNFQQDDTDSIQNEFADTESWVAARTITDFCDASKKERDEVWTVAPNVKVAFGEKRILNHISDYGKQKWKKEHGTLIEESKAEQDAEKGTAEEPKEKSIRDDGSMTIDGKTYSKAEQQYDEEIAKQYQKYTEKVTAYLDSALQEQKVEDIIDDLPGAVKSMYLAFGEADNAPYARQGVDSQVDDSELDPVADKAYIERKKAENDEAWEKSHAGAEEDIESAEEELGSDSVPWAGSAIGDGMIDKWLDAAADSIRSNGNCDYSPELAGTMDAMGKTALNMAESAAMGATEGAAIVGAATFGAGTGFGAVAGAISGTYRGYKSNEGKAWRYKKAWYARIAMGTYFKDSLYDPQYSSSEKEKEEWIQQASEDAIIFGYFNMRFYTKDELLIRFGEFGKVSDGTPSRFGLYLADPWYREQPEEVQREYVRKCITDYSFAKAAFFRICLLYLRVLISYDILPSFSYDVFRGALKNKENMERVLKKIREKRKQDAADAAARSEAGKRRGPEEWDKRAKEQAEKGVEYAESMLKEAEEDLRKAKEKADSAGEGATEADRKALTEAEKKVKEAQKYKEKALKEKERVADSESGDGSEDPAKELNEDGEEPGSVSGQDVSAAARTAADKSNQTNAGTASETKPSGEDTDAADNLVASATIDKYLKLFRKNQAAVDNGKTFMMVLMGVLDGNPDFMKILVERRFGALNNVIRGSYQGGAPIDPGADGDKGYAGKIRSFVRAMAGEEIIDGSKIGAGDTQAPGEVFSQYDGRRNAAAASDDPGLYMMHSFYDMVVHDCRGRMLRAFPTFYLVLIDEGRKIGRWKLHDNFYNVNSISSITISKSRKIPTDTAEIVMSNFYNTFTDNDENLNMNYTANYTDVFRSIWLPTMQSYAEEQDRRRTEAESPERFRLRPGARVHVRIGYGADASALPTQFNGMIAECETSDTVTLVCQSDGGELCKPIMLDKEAYDLPGLDEFTGWSGWCESGATPKAIMQSLLNYKGGAINSWMHDEGWDDIANMAGDPINPLGIYHFGNPDVSYAGEPETMQNILEVGAETPQERYIHTEKSMAGAALDAFTDPKEPPKLNFEVFGKTVWDVLNICKSVAPDYYAAVVPFHLRSSVFMGRGSDYYAYDYVNVGGTWCEKRKPYQQAHIYDSCTDIINNTMKVSTKDIRTCAIGLYEVSGFMNAKVQKKTDPQWVDANIYPEYQKTMYVDTKLFGEPSRKLGKVSYLINGLIGGVFNSTLDRAFDDNGDVQNHHAMAVNITCDALKQQMKEMYAGSFTVIGDPTVKPNDRIILNDTYDGIGGQCLVRDVVQVFSADAGYKTVITPDLITAQTGDDAAREQMHQSLGLMAVNVAVGSLFGVASRKMMHGVSDKLDKISKSSYANGALSRAKGYGDSAVRKLVSVRDGRIMNGIRNAMNATKWGAKAMSGGSRVLSAGSNAIRGLWNVGKAGASMAWLPVTVVATFGLGCAEDFIVSKINSRKRLVLFPLQKYGRPMVGGIDGNVGTVYGAPNFNSEDGMTQLLGTIRNELPQPIQDGLEAVGEMIGVVQEEKMDNMTKVANSPEGKAQLTYQSVNKSHIETFRKAYFNPAKTRLEVRKASSIQKARSLYAVMADTQDGINENPNFPKMRAVLADPRLKEYMDLGFFRVVAFERGFTSGISDKVKCLYIKDPAKQTYTPVNALIDKRNGTVDIPYLHGDALGVLDDIIKLAFAYMSGTEQTRDAAKWYKDNASSFITLTSALKCGSNKAYEATGFSFVLKASDRKSLQACSKAADQMNTVMEKTHEKMQQVPESVLEKKVNGSDIYIVVRPPKEADS